MFNYVIVIRHDSTYLFLLTWETYCGRNGELNQCLPFSFRALNQLNENGNYSYSLL